MNMRENINKKQNKLCKETENGISIKTYEARTIFLNHLEFEKQKDKLKSVPVESKKGKTYHETRTTDDINYYGNGEQKLRYYPSKSVFPDSLLLNRLYHKGSKSIKLHKISEGRYFTKDIIIVTFDYDTGDYMDENNENSNKSKEELRNYFYENDFQIHYHRGKQWNEERERYAYCTVDTVTYRYLYHTPGQAKQGKAVFVNKEIWENTIDYMSMGMYGKTDKIVELSAYSPLIVGTAIDYLNVPFESILIVKDQERTSAPMKCVSVICEDGNCDVKEDEKGITNILFDGEGLIDRSIFPENMCGDIYCRSHFFKSCLFVCNMQEYCRDYCNRLGADYNTYKVKDIFGNEKLIKDIKIVVTENSVKWIGKFDEVMGNKNDPYKYYKDIMTADYDIYGGNKDDVTLAIIKTTHKSKYGSLQRGSYQILNSIFCKDKNGYKMIANISVHKMFNQMQRNNDFFISYLKMTSNYYNLNDVITLLYEHIEDFRYTDFFRQFKSRVLSDLKRNELMSGKLFQVGDNFTVAGNPLELLKHAVGEDFGDGCFQVHDDYIECYTKRFEDGEFLAGFRSPHNSPNNIVYLKNTYNEELRKFFPDLGENVIVVNGIGTDICPRCNGLDFDSDFLYITNQTQIVEWAGQAYKDYPTIVNDIPKETKQKYSNDMSGYAQMDNEIEKNQMVIGLSSDIAQKALSCYMNDLYNNSGEENESSKKYKRIFIICSVLAQVAIDSTKRSYSVDMRRQLMAFPKFNRLPEFFVRIKGMEIISDEEYKQLKHRVDELKDLKENYEKGNDKDDKVESEDDIKDSKKDEAMLKDGKKESEKNKAESNDCEDSTENKEDDYLKIKKEYWKAKKDLQKKIRESWVEYLDCPMQILSDIIKEETINLNEQKEYQIDPEDKVEIKDIVIKPNKRLSDHKQRDKVLAYITEFDAIVKKYDTSDEKYENKVTRDFQTYINKIDKLGISQETMKDLIYKVLVDTSEDTDKYKKVKSRLLKALYNYCIERDKMDIFLGCFYEKLPQKSLKTA